MVTKESERDREIRTLKNIDAGYIRKFIIRKVDESSLFGRRNSQKSVKSDHEGKKKSKKKDKRRLSSGSLSSLKSNASSLSINSCSSISTADRRSSIASGRSSIAWAFSSSEDEAEESDSIMTAMDKDEDDPGVMNPAFEDEDEGVDFCKEDKGDVGETESETPVIGSDGERSSGNDTASICSLESSASNRFNLKMSPRPIRRSRKERNLPPSPVSYRSARSSVSSVRKGILKKTNSSTTINMEMSNISQPESPTENGHKFEYDDTCSNGDASRYDRSEDNIHLRHQRSFNRVKFILDSGKPDNVTGDYGDIKIDKGFDRIERGKFEEEENTAHLSNNGRRCLLYTAGLLIVTLGVILVTFFNTKNKNPKIDLTTSSNTFIENAIQGTFKIDDFLFKAELADYESSAFKNISQELQTFMLKAIFNESYIETTNSTVILRIIKYEKDPLFRMKWEKPDKLTQSLIKSRIVGHLNKFGSFGKYRVDKSSLSITNLDNECRETRCSDSCKFSEESLRFECGCPDHSVLVNYTTCVSPPKKTEKQEPTHGPLFIPPKVSGILKNFDAQLISVVTVKKDPKNTSSKSNNTTKSTTTSTTTTESTSPSPIQNTTKSMVSIEAVNISSLVPSNTTPKSSNETSPTPDHSSTSTLSFTSTSTTELSSVASVDNITMVTTESTPVSNITTEKLETTVTLNHTETPTVNTTTTPAVNETTTETEKLMTNQTLIVNVTTSTPPSTTDSKGEQSNVTVKEEENLMAINTSQSLVPTTELPSTTVLKSNESILTMNNITTVNDTLNNNDTLHTNLTTTELPLTTTSKDVELSPPLNSNITVVINSEDDNGEAKTHSVGENAISTIVGTSNLTLKAELIEKDNQTGTQVLITKETIPSTPPEDVEEFSSTTLDDEISKGSGSTLSDNNETEISSANTSESNNNENPSSTTTVINVELVNSTVFVNVTEKLNEIKNDSSSEHKDEVPTNTTESSSTVTTEKDAETSLPSSTTIRDLKTSTEVTSPSEVPVSTSTVPFVNTTSPSPKPSVITVTAIAETITVSSIKDQNSPTPSSKLNKKDSGIHLDLISNISNELSFPRGFNTTGGTKVQSTSEPNVSVIIAETSNSSSIIQSDRRNFDQ